MANETNKHSITANYKIFIVNSLIYKVKYQIHRGSQLCTPNRISINCCGRLLAEIGDTEAI
jgi:hypothetical protein